MPSTTSAFNETIKKATRLTAAARAKLAVELRNRYAAGESIRALAAATGRSYGFVHRILTESGVSLRGRGGATRGKSKSPVGGRVTPGTRAGNEQLQPQIRVLGVDDPYKVFISYNGPDRESAEALAHGLQSRSIEVFLDQWGIRPGDQVAEKLRAAIEVAGTYLVLFGDSPEGSWVAAEREAVVAQAITNRRTIIPVRVGKSAIPPEFKSRQYITLERDPFGIDRAVEAVVNAAVRASAPQRSIPESPKNALQAGIGKLGDDRASSAAEAELIAAEARASGDASQEALALYSLGRIAQERGDYDRATDLYYQALATFQEIGDRRATAAALHQLGIIAQERGDYDRAGELLQQAMGIREDFGDRLGVASTAAAFRVVTCGGA